MRTCAQRQQRPSKSTSRIALWFSALPWCTGQSLLCVGTLCLGTAALAPQAVDLRRLVPDD